MFLPGVVPVFDSLTDRLSEAFRNLRGQARLDEKNIQDGLREVRLALLEADVHFKVVKDFVDRVREKALGADVLKRVDALEHVVALALQGSEDLFFLVEHLAFVVTNPVEREFKRFQNNLPPYEAAISKTIERSPRA